MIDYKAEAKQLANERNVDFIHIFEQRIIAALEAAEKRGFEKGREHQRMVEFADMLNLDGPEEARALLDRISDACKERRCDCGRRWNHGGNCWTVETRP